MAEKGPYFSGTARFKKMSTIVSILTFTHTLETSGGQSTNLYLNVVHFFNTSVN
jgi:hypothetical protein